MGLADGPGHFFTDGLQQATLDLFGLALMLHVLPPPFP